jgi:hypothetical protein
MMELSRRLRVFLSARSGGNALRLRAVQPVRPRITARPANRRNIRFARPDFSLRMRQFWSTAA